ncbi:hypothetical protein ACFQX6_09875 [Streptosporangium lutulentum]
MYSRLAERALVGGALRRRMQALHTSAALIRLHDTVRGGHGLAVGYGRDHGITVCLEHAGMATVDVIDLGAESRHDRLASLRVGYDIVGDFAVIQFLSHWRAAVSQVARILRPGGLFHFEVFTARALDRQRWVFSSIAAGSGGSPPKTS